VEISFLRKDAIEHWEHPTPFDLHYGEDWRNRYETALADGSWRDWNSEVRKDADLAAHITITNHRGVCLMGAPITSVFPAVLRHDYLDSILRDVREADKLIVRSPVYNMLNLCRVHYYLVTGAICSKDEGGVWGTHNVPPEFRSLVRQALAVYRGEQASVEADPAALEAFARWKLAEIERLAAGGGA
jgi:streptomycin 3"-adenylyltransferase